MRQICNAAKRRGRLRGQGGNDSRFDLQCWRCEVRPTHFIGLSVRLPLGMTDRYLRGDRASGGHHMNGGLALEGFGLEPII